MTTKIKSSHTSKSAKSSKVSAKDLAHVVNAAAASAPAGAGVGSGASAPAASPITSGGASISNKVGKESFNDRLAASLAMGEDFKVSDLRQRIASNWAAPAFTLSAEYAQLTAALAGVPNDIRERAINGARLAWLARPENAATVPAVGELIDYINANFSKEFKAVCGCAVPAASAVRVYSYTDLSVSTITADSNINDYLRSTAVPAGLSCSGLVSAVMTCRIAADIKRRLAASRAAARNDFKSYMAGAVRRSQRLGISAAVAARYFSMLLGFVPAADDRDVKKLRKNLSACWAALRTCENNIILAAPAGFWGAAAPIPDNEGGFCFPASLPAVPAAGAASTGVAKVRKLWAKRVGLLSSISTLNGLLRAAGAV